MAAALGRAAISVSLYLLDRLFEFFAQFGGLADVEDVENRLLAQEHEPAKAFLVFRRHFHFAQWLFRSQVRVGALEQLEFFFEFRRLHLLEIFFEALEPLFDLAKIADHQVELDVLDVAQRIDLAHVRNRGIVEDPDHVGERIHLPQMADVGGFLQASWPIAPTSTYSTEVCVSFLGL